MAHRLVKMPDLKPRFEMPTGGQWVEEVQADGSVLRYVREVLENPVPDFASKRRKTKVTSANEALGMDGLVWRISPKTGNPMTPVYEYDLVTVEEYVPVEMPNGNIRKNYDFRPSPEALINRRRTREREAFMSELADLATSRDISASDLVAALNVVRSGTLEQSKLPVKIEKGAGWFDVYYQGEKLNEKSLREKDAEAMVQSAIEALHNLDTGG